VNEALHALGLAEELCFQRVASMFCLYFALGPVRNWDDAASADGARFGTWFHGMFERGFSLAPSPYEAGFLCGAHTEAHVDAFVSACRDSLEAA
jgi:glutamate-1-semialdehyde 2,1-aminomutase